MKKKLNKSTKKIKIILILVFLSITVPITIFGGIKIMDNISGKSDIDFVHGKEAQNAIWHTINLIEDLNTGGQRVVKKFTIIDKSVKKHPMNGYELEIYLNDDPKLKSWIHLRNFGSKNGIWEADAGVGIKAAKLLKMED